MTSSLRNLEPRRPEPARTLAESEVLAAARAAQADVHAAEARKLAAAVQWARLHEVTDTEESATWGDSPVSISGPGAPLLAKGCIAEFAAVIGTTTNGGRAYLADAIELAHRLPAVYAEIQAGRLAAWKGRRIAGETVLLPLEAAVDLGERMAVVARKLSARATQQMIDETIAAVLPEIAQERADHHSTPRVVVDHRQVSFSGTSEIYGALEIADALDLDATLTREAEALKAAGCDASLDVRRAMALGRLARGEANVDRPVTLYVHLPADTDATAVLENPGSRLLTQAQVAAFCGNPDVRVTVKPVIDLTKTLASAGYDIPDRIKEHVELRDGTCIFPYCDRPARGSQKDHTEAWDDGGTTSTDNLGSLCQHHHNLKTHAGWNYTRVDDGVFLWRSPHGYAFLRDHDGTQDLTPELREPPRSGRRPERRTPGSPPGPARPPRGTEP
ncbi:hypothetical protein ABIE44_003810 [Marmoricola sp. OAE513]|uniref:HNH endonuclease signature motif containing protein n=1 Tax=Marmoricola sp. OAE513 TaxID=2817894 RepID=UPI001AE54114